MATFQPTAKQAAKFAANKFCVAFGVKFPLILAPMGGIAGHSLAAAVANAGGLGFVGTGGQNPHVSLHYVGVGDMVNKLNRAKANVSDARGIGIGLSIDGCLSKDAPLLDQILSQKPCNLWLSATDGNDGQTPTFGPFVRLARPHVQVFVQVKSPTEAKIAALTGAHAVVLQGKGSGGFVSAPEKPLSERKTSAAMAEATAASASASASAGDLTGTGYPGDELDVAFPPSFEDDVNAHLDWDWDIKTPGYDPRAATPPSAPTPTPPTLSPRYPLSELIPASIAAINSLGLRNPPLIVAAGGISTGTDIVQCFRLGADAVAIGTLFAVARESELSSDDKIAFAEAAALPRNNRSPHAASATATGTTRTNPDGSVVKIGDSSAFGSTYGFAGNNNKEMLSTAVNLPAAEILELLVADFCFQQDVEDATAAL